MARPEISIVVPVLYEQDTIAGLLEQLRGIDAEEICEVIVVDGDPEGGTIRRIEHGRVVTLTSQPWRSRQMNAGAGAASGEVLLFLHADTLVPEGYPAHIGRALARPGAVAGAFAFTFDLAGPAPPRIEWGTNLRARRLQLPYGDQGLFLRAELFRELGGFPDLPIMEDYELVRRLGRRGRIAITPAAARTSARRWRRMGWWRPTLMNALIILGYRLGVSPVRLARWYRRW